MDPLQLLVYSSVGIAALLGLFLVFNLFRDLLFPTPEVLTVKTTVRLSQAEIEEAGIGHLVKDLTQFTHHEINGVHYFDITISELLQVLVQKTRQTDLEIRDLISSVSDLKGQ